MCFNERLKYLREEYKISQARLGKEVGISQQTVWFYETGERQPSADVIVRLADFFNVSVDFLLGRTDNRLMPVIPDHWALLISKSEDLPTEIQTKFNEYMMIALKKWIRVSKLKDLSHRLDQHEKEIRQAEEEMRQIEEDVLGDSKMTAE